MGFFQLSWLLPLSDFPLENHFCATLSTWGPEGTPWGPWSGPGQSIHIFTMTWVILRTCVGPVRGIPFFMPNWNHLCHHMEKASLRMIWMQRKASEEIDWIPVIPFQLLNLAILEATFAPLDFKLRGHIDGESYHFHYLQNTNGVVCKYQSGKWATV